MEISPSTRGKWICLVLRLAVAGEFFGHSMTALFGKKPWADWIARLTGADAATAAKLLFLVALADLTVAAVVLFRPIRAVLLWAAIWGFWTALLRPIVGEPIWEFIERGPNWGAPLALFLLSARLPLPSLLLTWRRTRCRGTPSSPRTCATMPTAAASETPTTG